eukprot:364483-Chlamydomonas_euryale.AAC.9
MQAPMHAHACAHAYLRAARQPKYASTFKCQHPQLAPEACAPVIRSPRTSAIAHAALQHFLHSQACTWASSDSGFAAHFDTRRHAHGSAAACTWVSSGSGLV